MDFRKKGKMFCHEINEMLKKNNISCAFVTGGGFAYDSIKYRYDNNVGDFDFMIIYDSIEDLNSIIKNLICLTFSYNRQFLNIDMNLLRTKQIDIIRITGHYLKTKATINLVPKALIDRVCNLERNILIKKIAHERNTSLFYAYGTNKTRITTLFIAPSFIYEGCDHYIHLDISVVEKQENLYFGILADAVLKGFNENYDNINFKEMRRKMICNIHEFFKNNNINPNNYISIYANNSYFPNYIKEQLIKEFIVFGKYAYIHKDFPLQEQDPMIFKCGYTTPSNSLFPFLISKKQRMNFKEYILKMQTTEYDRQYLIDAIGKFLGYILNVKGNLDYSGKILEDLKVYGINDLYLEDCIKLKKESIIKSLCEELSVNHEYNSEFVTETLKICKQYLKSDDVSL